MAAALTGFWYLQTCAIADSDNGETGLNALQSVLSPDRVRRTLQCIYRANVCSIQNGQLGAINGAYPDGTPDISSLQSEEIWPGVVYSLASSMLLADLPEQAMKTAHGCFTACLRFGLHFQTPEAIFMHKRFRLVLVLLFFTQLFHSNVYIFEAEFCCRSDENFRGVFASVISAAERHFHDVIRRTLRRLFWNLSLSPNGIS